MKTKQHHEKCGSCMGCDTYIEWLEKQLDQARGCSCWREDKWHCHCNNDE